MYRHKRCKINHWVGKIPCLEEGMATHSSILAGEFAWTEESGGLQSIGSQRVGHDWSDLAQHSISITFIEKCHSWSHFLSNIDLISLINLKASCSRKVFFISFMSPTSISRDYIVNTLYIWGIFSEKPQFSSVQLLSRVRLFATP